MPELLIAPPVAPSSTPAVSPKPGAASESKPQAASASEPGKSAAAPATAGQGTDNTPKTFSSVLKQQIDQTKEAAAKDTRLATDPLALAAEPLPELQGAEATALLPFIEQLLPQLAKKFQNTDDKTTPATDTTLAASDAAASLIAGPLTAAVEGAARTVATTGGADAGTANAEAAAPMLDLDPAARDKTTARGAVGENLAAASAISAEGALAESAATGKTETDFSALVTRATEQLASNSPAHGTSPAHATASRSTDTALRMDTPVGHADWSKELGNKLSWMATAQRQQADLVLNPPQLGRVEISLTVSGDQASAVFTSPSASVRELLEDSLPRLREILSGSGINLGEAQVGAESQNRFGAQEQGNNGGRSGRSEPVQTVDLNGVPTAAASGRTIASGRGMVDLFA